MLEFRRVSSSAGLCLREFMIFRYLDTEGKGSKTQIPEHTPLQASFLVFGIRMSTLFCHLNRPFLSVTMPMGLRLACCLHI